MFTKFEGEFGDIKIPKIKIKEVQSKDNELVVKLWDEEELLAKTSIPKGSCRLIHVANFPVPCPHCHKELPHGLAHDNFQEFEIYEYKDATIKDIEMIEKDEYGAGNIVKLHIHYETMEYKQCYQNEKNSTVS